MNRLKCIIVGVDFSACSAAALRQAIRIARWNHAKLLAVHVIEKHELHDFEAAFSGKVLDPRSAILRNIEATWTDFLAAIPESEHVEFKMEIEHPAATLLLLVEKNAADLLVLGTHGHSGPDHATGTTAAACIRKSHAPVLLVHDPHGGPFKSVLACIDFSAASLKALAHAVAVAAQDQSRLNILHVYDGPWNRMHYRSETMESSPEFQKQYRENLQAKLREFCRPLEQDFNPLKPQFHLLDYPSHGGGIEKFVVENKVDLVVLGTRGRTNLRDLLIGSTAERVLRDTPCSILAVKPD